MQGPYSQQGPNKLNQIELGGVEANGPARVF